MFHLPNKNNKVVKNQKVYKHFQSEIRTSVYYIRNSFFTLQKKIS